MNMLLIKRAQKHDTDAFIELIEKNKTALYKVAKAYLKNEEDIADAMQDTILSAYEHIGELRVVSYFKTWLTRILINHCTDTLRRQRRVIPMKQTGEQRGDVSSTKLIPFEKTAKFFCFLPSNGPYSLVRGVL